jgi:hypothetical protein
MEQQEHKMIPIWFIIGINVLVYGIVIGGYGVLHWNQPAEGIPLDIAKLHADFWWGAMMTVIGLFYTIRFCPGKGT